MLRRTGLLWLTFDQLLLTSTTSSSCSSAPVTASALTLYTDTHDARITRAMPCNDADATRFVHAFRELSPHAPLPLLLARAWVGSLVRQARYDDAAAVAKTHPLSEQLVRLVATDLTQAHNVKDDSISRTYDYSIQHILDAVNSIHACVDAFGAVNVLGVAYLLQAMSDWLCRSRCMPDLSSTSNSAHGQAYGSCALEEEQHKEQVEWLAQVERVRAMILTHMRAEPSSVCVLLSAFCQLSCASASSAVEDEMLKVLHVAMHSADKGAVAETVTRGAAAVYVNAQSFAHVLRVLVMKTHNYRRAISLWSWMRHTSARCDGAAVSMIILSYCALHKVTEAVQCVQELASMHVHPTVLAQVALLRCLGESRPPMHEYAEKLMAHWYAAKTESSTPSSSSSSSLWSGVWRGETQDVGIELIAMHFRLHHRKRVVELIHDACRVFAPHVVDDTNDSKTASDGSLRKNSTGKQRCNEVHNDDSARTLDTARTACCNDDDYFRFVNNETIGHVICYLEANIVCDPVAVRVLFDGVLTWMKRTGAQVQQSHSPCTSPLVVTHHPFLIGMLILLGHRLGRVPDVMNALQPCVTMTDESFVVIVNCISTYGASNIAPEVQFELIKRAANQLERDVPRDVAAWYKLLTLGTSPSEA